MLKYNILRHPGEGHIKVVCDVCNRVIFRKDAIKVTDKLHRQFGLLVCKEDYDQLHLFDRPAKAREKPATHPENLRPERPLQFSDNENDDRVPSAPRNLKAQGSSLGSTVELFWEGPIDTGSSGIIGYVIQRAFPQLGIYETISANTNSFGAYYNDTSADITSVYSYRIAAINTFGTGPFSNEALFPSLQYDNTYFKFIGANENYVVATDQGYLIIPGDQ